MSVSEHIHYWHLDRYSVGTCGCGAVRDFRPPDKMEWQSRTAAEYRKVQHRKGRRMKAGAAALDELHAGKA